MTKGVKEFLKFASLPLMLFGLMGLFLALYTSFGLPGFDEILEIAEAQFAVHGYWVVFVAALIEGFILVNWFFPGSIVIVMGSVFAVSGEQNEVLTFSMIILGLYIMSIVNFLLGKYGWYRVLVRFGLKTEIEHMQRRLTRHGLRILAVTYFHPHIGSLAATTAGILQIGTRRFVVASLLTFLSWGAIWAGMVYAFGPELLQLLNFQNLMVLIAAWIGVMGIQFIWKKTRPAVLQEEEVEI